MEFPASPSAVLAAMVTPAVLISACGTLILSTSNRLARVIDRMRHLSREMERMAAEPAFAEPAASDAALRWGAFEQQLGLQTRRGRLLQRALTSFYVALGCFVATTTLLAAAALRPMVAPLPPAIAILGALILFYGSVLLVRETALALRSVDIEMALVLELRERHRPRPAQT